ncbi:MAG: GNAT family N-acetyltransferase [Methanomicrobia archaeon]|nr:GNAT family N-acetyltransferase [Methanomicrobia archaeon]
MTVFRLKKAERSDLEGIVRLWKRNIRTVNTAEDIAEFFDTAEQYFFVALAPGSSGKEILFGFVGGAIRGGHGHISGIAVEKRYRRCGVGEELITALELAFLNESFTTITLEVRISNSGAIRFYEKQGYRLAYTVTGYYADGEDAFVYVKKFR